MDFSALPPRKGQAENIVPMINVVFLLLIFFLMTAQIAAPVPFEVAPPRSDSSVAEGGPATLHVGADGALFFQGAEGEAVWPLIAPLADDTPFIIRADAGFDAAALVGLLGRLTDLGLTDIALATERRP